MAVDESLLQTFGSERVNTGGISSDGVKTDGVNTDGVNTGGWILRFYSWSEPTLSLGYFQNHKDRQNHEASRECPLVRRASGGGAIMHDRELTYSFVAPVTHRFAANVELIYDLFHETLIASIAELTGSAAELCVPSDKVARADEPFLCFQRRAKGDVLIDGNKVCGSAQRRRKNSVLQHGSVLLDQSPFAPELPGIVQLTGKSVTSDELVHRWLSHLSIQLNIPSKYAQLEEQEKKHALEIEGAKFGNAGWTERR
jgi:lipoate-protein ligase A